MPDECIHGLDPRTCATCLHGPEPRVEQSDRGTAHCRSCGADIIWVVTANGKRMPLDAVATSTNGRFVKSHIDAEGNKVVLFMKGRALEENTKPLYASHFQTCPDAKEHRRAR